MSLESGHHQTAVYGADSLLLQPGKLLLAIWHDVLACRQLAFILAVRDLRAQYRQSLFGIFWILAPPIIVAVGLTVAKKNNLIDLGDTKLPTLAFTLIGMSIWQMFATAVSGPLQVLGSYRSILTKVVVPPEAIIASSLVKLSITVVLQIVLIVFACIWFRLPVTGQTIFALPAMVCVVLSGTAIGLILTPVGLLYRDIALAIPIIEKGLLIVTPVLYTSNHLARGGFFATTVRLNPLGPLIETTRQLISGEHLTQLPQFFGVLGLMAILLVFGLIFVRVAMPLVIERWSA